MNIFQKLLIRIWIGSFGVLHLYYYGLRFVAVLQNESSKKFSKIQYIMELEMLLKHLLVFYYYRFIHVLTPSDCGVLDTLATGVLILSILFGLRITDGGSRYYYETEDEKEKGTILFTVFVINFFTIVPSLILAFFSNEISIFLFKTNQYNWVVFASCLSIPLTLLNDEQSWIYRYKRLPWRFNIYILTRALVNIVMGILLVLYLKKGVLGAHQSLS
ncbi:MAG: hypothetical protein IPJ03_18130 [Ignavibacteriales bacterium]|nr:hypothetical protein [Ignavibacteriales bacterium]